MDRASLGFLLGTFIGLMIGPGIWLIIAMAIPPLRRRRRTVHVIAAAITWAMVGLAILGGGKTVPILVSALLVSVLIWSNYRWNSRARERPTEQP